uniref:C2H2-type zinc-finger transcription factor M5 n=1 Tax=Phoma sp. (strain ATCC 20986 / MF5453) TaxID=1828523 RepID=MFM5_PHOSM|nr:RecName: Full=C2H2-type zinc-finger transcription factor M5; AltName: Full=Squalestatin S1 biosynthesis cluster protein M5 [Phoma sp. MF5453]AMY15062.1 mfM5 protein [Phoma sp. MF5453]
MDIENWDTIDQLMADSAQPDFEDWGDLGDLMPDVLPESNGSSSGTATDNDNRCWDHGCNGKKFLNHSNLVRHRRENGSARPRFTCPMCGAYFSRSTARNQHLEKKSCNRVRRYSNGRERPRPRVKD